MKSCGIFVASLFLSICASVVRADTTESDIRQDVRWHGDQALHHHQQGRGVGAVDDFRARPS